jgi:hypothetical protein
MSFYVKKFHETSKENHLLKISIIVFFLAIIIYSGVFAFLFNQFNVYDGYDSYTSILINSNTREYIYKVGEDYYNIKSIDVKNNDVVLYNSSNPENYHCLDGTFKSMQYMEYKTNPQQYLLKYSFIILVLAVIHMTLAFATILFLMVIPEFKDKVRDLEYCEDV